MGSCYTDCRFLAILVLIVVTALVILNAIHVTPTEGALYQLRQSHKNDVTHVHNGEADRIRKLTSGTQDRPFTWVMPSAHDETTGHSDGTQNTGNRSGIELEVVLDPVCPDSVRAWEVMKDLRQEVAGDELRIVVGVYPLPYHRNSFLLTELFLFVRDKFPTMVGVYLDAVFGQYNALKSSSTRRSGDDAVLELISSFLSQTNIPVDMFVRSSAEYYTKAIVMWKYHARRGVAGAPWYFVNGENLGRDPNQHISLGQWMTLINALVKG